MPRRCGRSSDTVSLAQGMSHDVEQDSLVFRRVGDGRNERIDRARLDQHIECTRVQGAIDLLQIAVPATPPRTGMQRSRTITSNSCEDSLSTASRPFPTAVTSIPRKRSARACGSRSSNSSSAMRTRSWLIERPDCILPGSWGKRQMTCRPAAQRRTRRPEVCFSFPEHEV